MLRLSKNCHLRVISRSSSRRNYAVNHMNYGIVEIAPRHKRNFVPFGGAGFVQNVCNPTRDTLDTSTISHGFRYSDLIYKALHVEGSKALEAGAKASDLANGILSCYDEIETYLEQMARKVNTPKKIAQAAIAAANGDTKLGNLVAKGILEADKDAFYIISANNKENNEVEFVKALHVKRWRVYSRYFLTNKRNHTCLLKNPDILFLVDKLLNGNVVQNVQQAMRLASRSRPRSLLIIAEDVEKGVEEYLISNGSSPWKKIFVVEPAKDKIDRATMEDFAIFTGGQVVTGESDMNFIPQMLGSCKTVSICCNGMSILDAAGDEEDIEKRREQLRSAIQLDPSSPYLKWMEWRLRRLSPAVRFKVGGATNGRRVYDVLWATKLAMSDGILPGGGVALLNALELLDRNAEINSKEKLDVQLGFQLLQNALKVPMNYILSAAGFDASVAVEKLLLQYNPYLGYNSALGEYVDMIETGNVDIATILGDELRKAVSDYAMNDLGDQFWLAPRSPQLWPFPPYY